MSDAMAQAEVKHNSGSQWDDFDADEAERLLQEEAEAKANELISTAEGLEEIHDYTEWKSYIDSDLARAFNNLVRAFAGEKVAIDACLQSLLNMRNRARDDAIRMTRG